MTYRASVVLASSPGHCRRTRRPLPVAPVPRRDELLDDLPEEFVSLAKDMRALLDAGLIEASAVNDETVRFAIPEDQAGAA